MEEAAGGNKFDRIVVLKGGEVVEEGTGDQLKNKDGEFKRLLTKKEEEAKARKSKSKSKSKTEARAKSKAKSKAKATAK